MTSKPEVQALINHFAKHAYTQGKPIVAHLPLLLKYNVATALLANAAFLGITEDFSRWEGASSMNEQGLLLGLTSYDHFAH